MEKKKNEFIIKDGKLIGIICNEKTVDIPSEVTELMPGNTYRLPEIERLTIPSTVKEIPEYAFLGLNADKVILEEGVSKVGRRAFHENCFIKELLLPESLISIGECAFSCSMIKELVIPENVRFIDDYAFCDCPILEKITIKSKCFKSGIQIFNTQGKGNSLKEVILYDKVYHTLPTGTFESPESIRFVNIYELPKEASLFITETDDETIIRNRTHDKRIKGEHIAI